MDFKDMLRTKFENKLLIKIPEKGEDNLSLATRINEKRREIKEMDIYLVKEREEFKSKMGAFKERKEELEKKELHFKNSICKYEQFLKENDGKLRRAVKKSEEEGELQKSKQKEINRLNKEINESTTIKENLSNLVAKVKVFPDFLDNIVERFPTQFQETSEVIFRFETLFTNHHELINKGRENEKNLKQGKEELARYSEEKKLEILNLNNTLTDLQAELDNAENKRIEAENHFQWIQNTATLKTLQIGQTRMAIRNLYDQVLIHQGKVIDKTKDVDLDSQLKKVLEFLIDLTAIINELNREFRVFQFTRSQSLSDIKQNVGDVRRTYSSGIQRMAEINTIKL